MDITHARVMLGDNQDYSNCTIMEPQIPSAWSDSSITVTTNLGQLTEPALGYLFVFDADDNHNASGYPVSIGTCPYFVGDLNNDCVVNFKDVNMMASDWLLGDYNDVAVEPNSEHLVALYEFEGNANDSSGNGLHGTLTGGATTDTDSERAGQVLILNGSSAHVLVNDDVKLHISDEITVAAWVKPADTGEGEVWRTIISKFGEGDTRRNLYLVFFEGDLLVSLEPACRNWASTGGIPENIWTYLTVTYDGSAVTVWLNGEYENSMSASGTLLLGGNTYPLYIGKNEIWGEHYTGRLDDVCIYDYALLESEIAYLAGGGEVYQPLESLANLYDEEPQGSKSVNLKDFAVMADDWLEDE